MDLSVFKKLTIGGVALKQLFINGIQAWKSGPKNWVPYSTESDGVTIYNGGLGYKSGYRVRSGGAESEQAMASCTGFIPVKGLSTIRVAGTNGTFADNGVNQAINVYDSSFTNLGQIVSNSTSGYGIFASDGSYADYGGSTVAQGEDYWEWTVPPDDSGIAYIRVTGYTSDGSQLVVTINAGYTNLADPNSTDWAVGYGISSSGELDGGSQDSVVTNYIKANPLDVIRFQNFSYFSGGRLAFYDADKNCLGVMSWSTLTQYGAYTTDEATGISTYIMATADGKTVTSTLTNAAYVRFEMTTPTGEAIITVNEKITESAY